MENDEQGWRELKSSTRNPNIQEAMASQPAISEPVPERAQAEPEAQPEKPRARKRHR